MMERSRHSQLFSEETLHSPFAEDDIQIGAAEEPAVPMSSSLDNYRELLSCHG